MRNEKRITKDLRLATVSLPPPLRLAALPKEFIQGALKLGQVGVVTNTPRPYAEKLLAHHQLEVPVVVAYHDTVQHKPHPQPLLKAAEKLRLPPNQCIYVGDAVQDIIAAANAKVFPIALTWDGLLDGHEEVKLAKAFCKCWNEVLSALNNILGANRWRLPMIYDPKGFQHIGHDLSLLAYQPVSSFGKTETNQQILAFKNNYPTAVQWVTDIVLQFFTNHEKKFRHKLGFRYLVSIPSSTAGRTNTPCERVCSALAQRFTWLTHIPHALERVQSVPQSHRVSYEERPKCLQHMQSIQYTGPVLHIPSETFVMLDDIITFGETSNACRSILKRETGCERVFGLFVGRTVGH